MRDLTDPEATWRPTAHAEVFDPTTELFSAVALQSKMKKLGIERSRFV